MTAVLQELCWIPVIVWAQFHVLIIPYKALIGLSPRSPKDCLTLHVSAQPLRYSGEDFYLEVPPPAKARLVASMEKALSVVAFQF